MRNAIAFDHRVTRNVAKAICEANGTTVHYLDEMGSLCLGAGRKLVLIHTPSGNRQYLFVDQNSDGGLLDVRHMPEQVRQAAIDQMCATLGISRDEVAALIAERKEREADLAVAHALRVG